MINVDKLWSLVSEQTRTRYASDPEGKAPVIDCVRSVLTLALTLTLTPSPHRDPVIDCGDPHLPSRPLPYPPTRRRRRSSRRRPSRPCTPH